MDATLRFGLRNALHAMAAGFEFEPGIGAAPDDACNHLLVAADLGVTLRHDLDLPAIAFGKTHVHAEQLPGKQRRLVPARTGANFEEGVAFVVGVLGQQGLLDFQLDAGHARLRRLHLILAEGFHFRITQHVLGHLRIAAGIVEAAVQFDHRRDFGVFLVELAVKVEVARRIL